MQKIISDIQKKKPEKKTASASSNVNETPLRSKKDEDRDNTVPFFLQRTIKSSSEPAIQRQPLEEEEEIQAEAMNTVQRQELDEEEEFIMAKLTIGATDDKYEQEADQVADSVMRMPEEDEEEDLLPANTNSTDSIQTKRSSGKLPKVTNSVKQVVQSPDQGEPVDPGIRSRAESVLGADLGHVRVHQDDKAHEAAQSIHAKAFTHQNNIWLGPGQSQNDTNLVAHELTHVLQQNQNSNTPAFQRWQWSRTQAVIADEPAEDVPPRRTRYEIEPVESDEPAEQVEPIESVEPDDPSAEIRDLRLLDQLREIARFPHTAHRRWHSLSRNHRYIVFWEMGRLYGRNFAMQFWQYANSRTFEDRVIYTNNSRIQRQGTRIPLDEHFRLATEMGYAYAGAGLRVGLLYSDELWVHPSGVRIHFHPSTVSEIEVPPQQCLDDWYINWRRIFNVMEEGVSVNLYSNEGVRHEVVTRPWNNADEAPAVSIQHGRPPQYHLYFIDLLNTQTQVSRTVNLHDLCRENFDTNPEEL